MYFFNKSRPDDLEMNLVPLIDVLLVIIIFLVVSATFARMNPLHVNLPVAGSTTSQPGKVFEITVNITADQHYSINSLLLDKPDVTAIRGALVQVAGSHTAPVIVIHADANANYQSVVSVLDAALQANYTQVTVMTRPTTTR